MANCSGNSRETHERPVEIWTGYECHSSNEEIWNWKTG